MDDENYPGPPKWVRRLTTIFVILVLAFIGLHLAGLAPTGGHGS